MKGAAKGLGLLVFALAAVIGAAVWLLKEEPGSHVDRGRVESAGGGGSDALATPVSSTEAPKTAAERQVEPLPVSPAAAQGAPTGPTAAFLSGLVIDTNGRPVANAEVSFGPPEGLAFGRRGPRGRAFSFGKSSDPIPDAVKTRTTAEGSFRLTQVPRYEGFVLRVDHPDFVLYTQDDLIVPSSGLEVGRITLHPGASISGQVFGPGGAKLAGAEVSLRDPPDQNSKYGFIGFSFGARGGRKTTSDAEGRFRLGGLPEGKAIAVADTDELVEATASVDLVPLQEVSGLMLRLERGHTLTGIVHEASGKAVAGAKVNASSSGDNNFAKFARFGLDDPDAVTAADGRFTIPGLKPGVYELSVDADGFAPKSVAGIDSASSAPIEIVLGASAHVSGSVRIHGSTEAPHNVQVQLIPYYGENNFGPAFEMPDSPNKSGVDGAFRVEDVDPGQYKVAARADGTTRALSTPITVEEGGGVDGLEIEVERGSVLTGRVLDAETGAPVANADVACFTQRPPAAAPTAGGAQTFKITSRVRGAGVKLGGFDPDRQNVGRAKSDADGRYEIQHLAAGSVVVDVSHPEYATTRSAEIEVAAASTKEGADVRLSGGGTVEGSVLGIDGKPRAGDRIDVESKSVAGVTRSAVADANGTYRIEHVPAGDALATRTESDGGGGGPTMVFKALVIGAGDEPETGKRIVVEEGKTVRVDFSQMEKPYIEGVVTCADGPVGGAIVSASPDAASGIPILFGAKKEATTGPDGRFRLADLDPGSWNISARHPQGLVPVSAAVKLESGSPARQDFFLEGGVIEGDVLAQVGKAKIAGATVALERVRDSGDQGGGAVVRGDLAISFSPGRRGGVMKAMRFGGGSEARVSTDRDGHYRIPWVPAGKYKVSVSSPGFLDAKSDDVEVKQNATVGGIDLALPPAAKLLVKLRSKSNGQVLGSCPVQLQSAEDDSDWGSTDAEGIARFESLKPGTWTATGKRSWNDASGQSSTVTCEAGRTAEITIDL